MSATNVQRNTAVKQSSQQLSAIISLKKHESDETFVAVPQIPFICKYEIT